MMSERYEPPQSSAGDATHALAKAGISSIPLVGSAATELFALIVAPPLERRRQRWMEEVGEALRQLEDRRGVRLEDLQEDEAFIDAAMSATQAALRTSVEEKRRALRNALLNSALPGAPDASTRQVFINLVEQLTEWHLRLLGFFRDPQGWFARAGVPAPDLYAGSPANVCEEAYPELARRREFFDQCWKDLHQRGLTNTPELRVMMTGSGTMARRASDVGEEFLRFIEDPFMPN